MATITTALVGGAGYPSEGLAKLVRIENTVDFSKVLPANTDVVQALPVPANALVLHVATRVVAAGTGSTTATIGDGADADGWIASVALDAAAGTELTSNGKFTLSEGAPNTIAYTHAFGASGGKFYSAADTIDLTIGGVPTTGKLSVSAVLLKLD